MELKKDNIEAVDVGTKKKSFKQILGTFGPGIIVALTALGAGDLVDSSVAGSHFGYGLMWVLIFTLLVRFVVVNIMARIDLCNNEGITILEGYSRIHRFYPYLFAFGGILMGHLQGAYMIKGAAEALMHLFGTGQAWIWAIFVVGISLFTMGRNVYNKLETIMKVLLIVMTLGFLYLAVSSKPDVGEMAKGIFAFSLPEGTGVFSALVIALSLVGAVAGSFTNFLYPRFIRDKGWTTPSHKKLQRNDLLFGVGVMIFINLAIWIVGAEVLRPQGIEVKGLNDIAQALSVAFGPTGHYVFYLGVFGILWSSILGVSVGFTKVALENYDLIKKAKAPKDGKYENHRFYKGLFLIILISPIIWSIPGAPGFVTLVVVVNAIKAVFIPAMAIGILILANKKKLLGKYTNNPLENIILSGTVILAIWGAIKIVIGFI